MKKSRMLSVLLAVVLVFTSAGMVFADDAPPPIEDQTLPPSGTAYLPLNGSTVYVSNGINFNWEDVPGADKYSFELQYQKEDKSWTPVIKPMSIFSKTSPVPPTTVTVTTKKPFVAWGHYRWRVTAINTDVGIDPPGTGQSSIWWYFEVFMSPMYLYDMYPDILAAPVTSYSGEIDYKKGDGSNVNAPILNWYVSGGAGIESSTLQFKVTLTQGKNKWSKTVPASSACTTIDIFDARCHADFPIGALTALTPGLTYTWEVLGQDLPTVGSGLLFPTPSQVMPVMKDTLQYNEVSSYPALSGAVVTDTEYTNKPTFEWVQPTSALPSKAGYQLVVEKANASSSGTLTYLPKYTQVIVPGVTKDPNTKALACPASGGSCYWSFATPFAPSIEYRWNVRILASGKYGPWANISGPHGNSFYAPTRPTVIDVETPVFNQINSMGIPTFIWETSSYYYKGSTPYYATHYQVDITRVSPAPLTKTVGGLVDNSICTPSSCKLTGMSGLLPTEYSVTGLPRGVYQIVVWPKMRIADRLWGVFKPAVKSPASRFIVAPDPTSITDATYNPGTKKLNVTFNEDLSVSAANVKYRLLVKKQVGSLWRWVKIGTFAGTTCPGTGLGCMLTLTVYKPGTTLALDSGYYEVQIQEAKKEEGNTNPAKNNLWGPFGQLSPVQPINPF